MGSTDVSDYAFGLIVSSGIALMFLVAGFWPRRRRRNRVTGLRAPISDPRSSIDRFRRELGLR